VESGEIMPKIQTVVHSRDDYDEKIVLDVDVNINAKGIFYAHVPDDLVEAIQGTEAKLVPNRRRKNKLDIHSDTFAGIQDALEDAANALLHPQITEEHVIRYHIGLHVSFAVNKKGETCRNGYDGGNWVKGFGNHDASHRAEGGYSICIGASAKTKFTRRYGTKEYVSYENYYKGEHSLGLDNPAQKLNAWCSFSLPDDEYDDEDAKEISYTDEAAEFFDSMMRGVVDMARAIDAFMGTKDRLLSAIESGSGIPLLGAPKERE